MVNMCSHGLIRFILIILLPLRLIEATLQYSWDTIPDGRRYNSGKMVSSNNVSVVAAITTGSSLLISFDYGALWKDMSYILKAEGRLMDLCMDDTGRYITTVSSYRYDSTYTHEQGAIYLSEDYGGSYRKVTLTSEYYWHSVCADSTGQYLAAATSNNGNTSNTGRIFTSFNYGYNWTESVVPGDYSFDWYCLAAYRDRGFIFLVAASNHGLYASSDFGLSWAAIPAAPSFGPWSSLLLFLNASANSELIITGIVRNDTVVFSGDMGATWKQLVVSNSVPQFADDSSLTERSNITTITASDGGRIIIIAGDAGIFPSFDFGINFLTNTPPSPAPSNMSAIVTGSTGQILLAYSTHSLSMYVGNLCKWTEQILDVNSVICTYVTAQYSWNMKSAGSSLNPGSYLRSDTSGKYIGYGGCYGCDEDDDADHSYVYMSSDYGSTFNFVDDSFMFDEFSNFAISRSGKYWYALNYFSYYIVGYTSNYGKSWSSKYDAKTKCRGAALTDGGVIYAVCDDTSGSYIYESSDAGKSWSAVFEQASVTLSEIAVDSSGQYVIAIPAQGTYFPYSTDSGKSWVNVLPDPHSFTQLGMALQAATLGNMSLSLPTIQ
jgi:photosystem II stability/assembly factor-like uncharacterized protein